MTPDTLPPLAGQQHTTTSRVSWAESPWDRPHFGRPVLQLTEVAVDAHDSPPALDALWQTCAAHQVALVSCRLPAQDVAASIWLERQGFRVIEMVYHVECELPAQALPNDAGLRIVAAQAQDLPALQAIASTAFGTERMHQDPRIDNALADRRYAGWVSNALTHPRQRVHGLWEGEALVGFFVTELLEDGTCYWHLTAIGTEHQGKGLGRRCWLGMMSHAQAQGAQRIRTCVAARNFRVINLYGRLGFRLMQPQVTLHWMPQ